MNQALHEAVSLTSPSPKKFFYFFVNLFSEEGVYI
jgi:hypothetical protein